MISRNKVYINLSPRDKKELYVMEFLNDVFVPEIKQIFKDKAPNTFLKGTEGRSSNQVSILCKAILDIALPKYKWEPIEYIMVCDTSSGRLGYNHGVLIGTHKKEDKILLVDMDRMHKNTKNIFAVIQNPNNPYFKIDGYENHKIDKVHNVVSKEEFEHHMTTGEEYYTSMTGYAIVSKALATTLGYLVMFGKHKERDFVSDLLGAIEDKYGGENETTTGDKI
ncbi:MAG: hypothetical protein ACRCX2_28635 [Paraclostridium sp.]